MIAVANRPDGYVSISRTQESFKSVLFEHLALENEEFYPRLIAAIGASDAPSDGVERIKRFIAGMKDIGIAVESFLKKYADDRSIRLSWPDYKKDLAKCASLLEIRMESEEQGVYMEWEIYGADISHWQED